MAGIKTCSLEAILNMQASQATKECTACALAILPSLLLLLRLGPSWLHHDGCPTVTSTLHSTESPELSYCTNSGLRCTQLKARVLIVGLLTEEADFGYLAKNWPY